MPKKDFISYILIIFFPLFLLGISVFSVVFDDYQYAALFEKLGVHGSVQNADGLNKEVLDYLLGKEPALPQVFNEREIGHMEDVKNIFAFFKRLLILYPLLCIAAYVKWSNHKKEMGARVIEISSLTTLIVMGIILPLIVLVFPSSFGTFHQLFFEEGSYLFDPSTDLLVQLYPEGLFFAFAWKIAVLTVLLAALSYFFGTMMKKDLKQERTKHHS